MKLYKKLIWLFLFSVAMGYLEATVVVYLRKIYYPEGFNFPLKAIEPFILSVEIGREFATLIMLLAIGIFLGKTKTERFAYFIMSFAIWDIFYYVFLKLTLNWPESLLTWDILFLIPTTWTGPVITPIILSLIMVALGGFIVGFTKRNIKTYISKYEWLLLITGSIVLIISFTLDYSRFILEHISFLELFDPKKAAFVQNLALSYIPQNFYWGWFISGLILLVVAITLFCIRNQSVLKNTD